MSHGDITKAVDLWGKRIRVWYSSERRWKTAKVRWFSVDEPTRGKWRVLFQLTCGGKVNPWYYPADEIHPLKGKGRASGRAAGTTGPARRRRGSVVRSPGRGR